MDAKCGIMMRKLKGRMDKGGHDDVEMKGWMQKEGIIRCNLKGWMDEQCFRPLLCTVKAELGRGQPGLMR